MKADYQEKTNKEIQILLERISVKCKNFKDQNLNAWHGDLGFCLTELQQIDSFINDKYLNK